MADKESYHVGQEVLPWRTKSLTMADKEYYRGGQRVLPCRPRSLTMSDKESYHGGQKSLTMADKGLVGAVPPVPPLFMFCIMAIWRQTTEV